MPGNLIGGETATCALETLTCCDHTSQAQFLRSWASLAKPDPQKENETNQGGHGEHVLSTPMLGKGNANIAAVILEVVPRTVLHIFNVKHILHATLCHYDYIVQFSGVFDMSCFMSRLISSRLFVHLCCPTP